MKIAIYSPYLDTFGGGEKYMITIAEILSSRNHVDMLLDRHLFNLGADQLKNELVKRFNLSLESVNFIKAPIGKKSSFFSRIFFLKKYDLLFYLTDGSIFIPTAKKNILHIQSPLVGQPAKSFWGKLKLNGWNLIIYNSLFTQMYSERNWPLKSTIIYPPVDVDKIKTLKKKKFILSVGRFFGYLEDKKHAVLIDAFKDLYKNGNIKDWSLNLVGSAGSGDKTYLDKLKKDAEDLPINFYPNLDYDSLVRLYGQSSVYWHASGFGEDEPTKMEHFGISTVEAMSGGCVPVVIGKGGQAEIVEDKKSGFLWQSLDALKFFTMELINNNSLMRQMRREATRRAKKFNKQIFTERIYKIV